VGSGGGPAERRRGWGLPQPLNGRLQVREGNGKEGGMEGGMEVERKGGAEREEAEADGDKDAIVDTETRRQREIQGRPMDGSAAGTAPPTPPAAPPTRTRTPKCHYSHTHEGCSRAAERRQLRGHRGTECSGCGMGAQRRRESGGEGRGVGRTSSGWAMRPKGCMATDALSAASLPVIRDAILVSAPQPRPPAPHSRSQSPGGTRVGAAMATAVKAGFGSGCQGSLLPGVSRR
jgi:hypothetical protein